MKPESYAKNLLCVDCCWYEQDTESDDWRCLRHDFVIENGEELTHSCPYFKMDY